MDDLLKYYIEETHPYILYFGLTLYTLSDYPDKVYYCNSKFAIHGRIQEMITYLKYQD